MKIENLNLETLKEFAKLYDVYEVLDFEDPQIMDTKEKEFNSNFKAQKPWGSSALKRKWGSRQLSAGSCV